MAASPAKTEMMVAAGRCGEPSTGSRLHPGNDRVAASLLAVALVSTGPPVVAVELDLRGSLRARAAFSSPVEGPDSNLELRARPELVAYLREGFSATLTFRGQLNQGATEEALGESEVEVDRAFFDLGLGRWDLRFGRQAINFGQALIWNPVDLVDSNSPFDFDIVKAGLDAFRVSYALSSTASVMALFAFPDDGSISLLRGELLVGNADVGALAAELGRDDEASAERVIGLDLKGDLAVGYWAEATFHRPGVGEDFYRFVVGLDYSFPVRDQLYLALQYYRDSSGGTGVDDYDYEALTTGRRFLARQYASIISSLALDEFTALDASVLFNLEDNSSLLTLGLTRVFFDDLEVTLRGSRSGGSGPGELHPIAGSPLAGRRPGEIFELYLEWSL